ncbi:uncharacterized protein LOC111288881 isoform X1 [Durio zibethinus]|uniref:Uncharacterized protein LOC111288881 isoform X1 n=1 Tax=Durio zibethinus TaxID=66656 RepID=A0A6P5Y577_DURZI|nr:uncharacterized protein LOC111288881 isoform X1 [Durio zibethinus]
MPSLLHGLLPKNEPISLLGISAFPSLQPPTRSASASLMRGTAVSQILYKKRTTLFLQNGLNNTRSKKQISIAPRCSRSSNSNDSKDQTKTPFGYTRKDVLLIGLGVTLAGVGLKSGLEFAGVDPLQAGNVVQLVMVLGLTVGWISTYIFRVSNKEMTYAQQLRDYEVKVMQKRLEGLTEAELEALLEQVEEEKQRQASGEQVN